jgi:hypothetical protein
MKHLPIRIALAGALALRFGPVFSQPVSRTTPQTVIKDFLHAVYQTAQDPLAIAHRYIALQDGPNEFSSAVRYHGAAEHLALLRTGQTVGQATTEPNKRFVFNPLIHAIVPYGEVPAPRLAVSLTTAQEKTVYVLTESGKPLRYFLVHDHKIVSFDYLMKGTDGPAYPLGY